MSEKLSAAPQAHPSHAHDGAAHAPVVAGQKETKDKAHAALAAHPKPGADAHPKPTAEAHAHSKPVAGPSHGTEHGNSDADHGAEEAIIPTPGWMEDKKTSWPSRKNVIHGAAFLAAVINPVATIPVLAGLWGASKAAKVARKYVPGYQRAENGVKNVVSLPFKGAKALASSVYKTVEHPVNSLVLNPVRKFILRPSLALTNWVLDIPKDILQFVETKLGIIERPKGRNKIDGPAVAFLGVGHVFKSVVKELWAHKKTTAVAVALLYGATMLPGGIPGFLSSISGSFAAIVKGGLGGLGNSVTTGGAVTAPAAGGGSFMGNTVKWMFGY